MNIIGYLLIVYCMNVMNVDELCFSNAHDNCFCVLWYDIYLHAERYSYVIHMIMNMFICICECL